MEQIKVKAKKWGNSIGIVLPVKVVNREDIKEGENLMIIKDNKQLIMKRVNELDKNFREYLEFAKRTEAAWEKYEKGEFKSSTAKEFLKDLKKW